MKMLYNVFTRKPNKPVAPDVALKATALIYLKDALDAERYEDCPELISAAKGFGADSMEIRTVIAKHLRGKGRGARRDVEVSSRGIRRF